MLGLFAALHEPLGGAAVSMATTPIPASMIAIRGSDGAGGSSPPSAWGKYLQIGAFELSSLKLRILRCGKAGLGAFWGHRDPPLRPPICCIGRAALALGTAIVP